MGKRGRPKRVVSEGMRWCGTHQKEEPISDFTENSQICKLARYQLHVKRKYGLTPEEYDDMLVKQNGLCAICQKREPKYVDHCHDTGVVRGILCPGCNTAIGQFEDDIDIINRAIDYLQVARN